MKCSMTLPMIDISDWSNAAKLLLLGMPFLLMLMGIVITIHIAASRHFQTVCRAFGRSSGLSEEIKVWGTHSLHARALIVSAMSAAVIWPSIGVRRGWLDPKDVEELPRCLKRRIQIAIGCLSIGVLWLFAMYLFRFKS